MIHYKNIKNTILIIVIQIIKSLAFIIGSLLVYNYINTFRTNVDPAEKEALAPFVLLIATIFALYYWIKVAKKQFKSLSINEDRQKIIIEFLLKEVEIPFSELKYKKNIKNEEEFYLELYNKNESFFKLDNNNLEGLWLEEIQEIINIFDANNIKEIE